MPSDLQTNTVLEKKMNYCRHEELMKGHKKLMPLVHQT